MAEKRDISQAKKDLVKKLSEKMKSKTVMIVSINKLPSKQFQDIKKKIRNYANIQVTKKNLIDYALDHCGIKELHGLVPYVQESTALLFSDMDAFEISSILADNKSPSKAKAGDVAPFNIEVKAGPTDLVPGQDISALSSVGLIPKVENGKISVMQDKILVKMGDVINDRMASVLGKLNVIPFEVGIEPIAAYIGGIIYSNIKIDKKDTIEKLEKYYSRSLAFAVEVNYLTKETVDFIITRAVMHANALNNLNVTEKNVENQRVEEAV